MTAQEYPAQLPVTALGMSEGPGDAPESASGIESGPPGIPLMAPAEHTVEASVTTALRIQDELAQVTAYQIPNMPDPQMSREMNDFMGTPEATL